MDQHAARLTLIAVLAACGTEPPAPGVLTIVANPVPPVVTSTTLVVSGQVSRDPPLDIPITVRATGGGGPADALATPDGTFTVPLTLAPNMDATVTLTASDSAGSTAEPVVLQVTHDGLGPTIVSSTPTSRATGVAAGSVIEVHLSEPVDPGFLAGIHLARGGMPLTVDPALSPDSLTIMLAPGATLAPGALFELRVAGLRDPHGNPQPSTFVSCFSTVVPGDAAVFADPANDLFQGGNISGLSPADFLGGHVRRDGALLDAVLRYTTNRTFVPGQGNTLFAILDLDVDKDAATGFTSFKDAVFTGLLPPSNTGAEYTIGLTRLPSAGDSAIVGIYQYELEFAVTWRFQPLTCGPDVGFTIPTAAFGSATDFHLVSYHDAASAAGIVADAGPDGGAYAVTLPATTAPAAGALPGGRRTFRWPRTRRP